MMNVAVCITIAAGKAGSSLGTITKCAKVVIYFLVAQEIWTLNMSHVKQKAMFPPKIRF